MLYPLLHLYLRVSLKNTLLVAYESGTTVPGFASGKTTAEPAGSSRSAKTMLGGRPQTIFEQGVLAENTPLAVHRTMNAVGDSARPPRLCPLSHSYGAEFGYKRSTTSLAALVVLAKSTIGKAPHFTGLHSPRVPSFLL